MRKEIQDKLNYLAMYRSQMSAVNYSVPKENIDSAKLLLEAGNNYLNLNSDENIEEKAKDFTQIITSSVHFSEQESITGMNMYNVYVKPLNEEDKAKVQEFNKDLKNQLSFQNEMTR